jgi:MFS family permease
MAPSSLRLLLERRVPALRHRNFRLYWFGQLLSLVGTWMQSVAQGWLLHRLTPSAFMLGLLGFLQFLPVLLLSLWAGVIADRTDKRRLIQITQTASLIQAVVMAALVTWGHVQPWMVLALAFWFGVINAFDLPARQSFLIELVGREDLSNAIALNSAAFNMARIVGPALAGVLLATLPRLAHALGLEAWARSPFAGEAGCFWINAVSYVAVLVSLARMDVTPAPAESSGARTSSHIAEGVRYVLHTPPIRNLLILLGCTAGLAFQYLTLLPVYVRELLHAGADAYGLLVSAFGVGALVAAAAMTRRTDRWGLRHNLLAGLLSSAVGLGVFAWSRWLPLSMIAGFLAGFGLILYVASTNTMIQLTTEDRFRGRVMSLSTLMFIGLAPLGSLMAGSIAEAAGAPVATTVSAVVLLGGAVWVFFRLRVLAAREARDTSHETEPAADRVG